MKKAGFCGAGLAETLLFKYIKFIDLASAPEETHRVIRRKRAIIPTLIILLSSFLSKENL
jgi:hypothetical protein